MGKRKAEDSAKKEKKDFSREESLLLLRLVEEHPLLDNKKTDAVTSKEKEDTWKKIESSYNAVNPTSGVSFDLNLDRVCSLTLNRSLNLTFNY